MGQKHKATKYRNFAIGFFGWFLVGNLYNLVLMGLVIMLYDTLDTIPHFLDFLEYSFSVATVIVVGILILKKRFRFVYGIVTAIITNTLIIVILGSIALSPTGEGYLDLLLAGVSVPLPLSISFVVGF